MITNNVIFNAIRMGKIPSAIPTGPGFYIDTVRTISDFYPAVGDWSGTTTEQFRVNMGQEPFQGDPMGFTPYDTNYIDSNWYGAGTVNSGLITPSNTKLMFYDKKYTSGKYYYEVYLETNESVCFVGMHMGNNYDASSVRAYGVGTGIYSSGRMLTWRNAFGSTTDSDWSLFATPAGSGTYIQVWLDFDNELTCVKKLGTTIDEYYNYVEA